MKHKQTDSEFGKKEEKQNHWQKPQKEERIKEKSSKYLLCIKEAGLPETNTHNKQNPICEQGVTDEKHQKPGPENVLVPKVANMHDNVPKSKMTF